MENSIFDAPPLRMIDLNPADVFAGMALAFILNLILAKISSYTNKSRTVNSSSSLPLSMILLGTVVSLIMAVIGNSLARAFGAIGALSLIRFRTAVKDPLDLVQLFMTISIGMTTGSGHFIIACGATLIFAVFLVIADYLPIKRQKVEVCLLKLTYNNLDEQKKTELFSLIKSTSFEHNIIAQESLPNSNEVETVFEILCPNSQAITDLFPKFREIYPEIKAVIINN